MSTNTGISTTHIFFFVGRSIGNILDGVGGSGNRRWRGRQRLFFYIPS